MSTRTMTAEAAHLLSLTAPNEVFDYSDGVISSVLPQADLDAISILPLMVERQITRINNSFSEASEVFLKDYPLLEIVSWAEQSAEAWAVTKNSAEPTPILDAIIKQTGDTKATLAANILAKEAAYKTVIGTMIGKRQSLIVQLLTLDLTLSTAEQDITSIIW